MRIGFNIYTIIVSPIRRYQPPVQKSYGKASLKLTSVKTHPQVNYPNQYHQSLSKILPPSELNSLIGISRSRRILSKKVRLRFKYLKLILFISAMLSGYPITQRP